MSTARAVNPAAQAEQASRWKFSQAIRAGEWLICSGQVGVDADGAISTDPYTQFVQAFENVDAVLDAGGMSRQHVIDMTTYHVDLLNHLPMFAEVRERWIGAARPAWTALGVAALGSPGALVEVKVTAWTGS